jgi:chromatin structure-remodeling complex protein RSC7
MPRRFDDESDASRKSGSTVGSDTGDDADVQANGPTLVQAGAALADEEDDDADIVVRPRSRNVRTIAEDGAVANKVKNGKGGAATVKPSAAISALSNDEEDEDGNEKIDQDGALLPPRQYTSRAFRLPTRGDQFWFLATEIARVTGYRDSYLFFNKNKNLTKLITSDAEKSYLIAQEL